LGGVLSGTPTSGTLNLSNLTLTLPAISLSSGVTGTLPIANGGTGQADPLFNYIRTITLSGLGTSNNGNGVGSVDHHVTIVARRGGVTVAKLLNFPTDAPITVQYVCGRSW
jgi:hypothetical protein